MPRYQVNKKLLLMKIHYFVGIGGYAPFSPFLTTISKQRGYSAFVVGLIFMLQPIPSLLLRPLIGALSDKYKCRREAFIGSTILTFVLVAVLAIIPGTASVEEMNDLDAIKSPLFWLFFGTISLINADGMVKNVLEDTICMDLLGEDKHKYGKQRLWGSIGWSLLAAVSGACVDWYSTGKEYKDYTPGYIIALICFFLDIYIVWKIKVVQQNNANVVSSDVRKVFTEGKVLAFLLWVVLFGFFMSFIWNYVFWYFEDLSDIYHPETKIWMKTIQGIALIIQCFLGEVPSFFLSSYVLKRMDHMTVFSLMFLMFTVVFTAYSFITDPLWALPLEVFNGITFALSYSAAISYVTLITPVGSEGTFQGIVGMALSGIGVPFGSIVGGYSFKTIGSITTFKVLSVVAGITCVTQFVVNSWINRLAKNEDVKDVYNKVDTKDDAIEESDIMSF